MAFEEYDKYEQSELVQKWLRENGLSIVVGIAIGLVGIFGWQQWNKHQVRNQLAAAQLYQQTLVASASGKAGDAAKLTEQLKKDHAKSPYAVFAASDRARELVQAGKYDKARASLDWAVAHTKVPALKSLSQLRVAQVQLAANDAKGALATLDAMPKDEFQALSQELRGDVLVKLGKSADARKAYQQAMASLDAQAPQRNALQLKLDDLATAGKQGA